jgi:hypothetical protein
MEVVLMGAIPAREFLVDSRVIGITFDCLYRLFFNPFHSICYAISSPFILATQYAECGKQHALRRMAFAE